MTTASQAQPGISVPLEIHNGPPRRGRRKEVARDNQILALANSQRRNSHHTTSTRTQLCRSWYSYKHVPNRLASIGPTKPHKLSHHQQMARNSHIRILNTHNGLFFLRLHRRSHLHRSPVLCPRTRSLTRRVPICLRFRSRSSPLGTTFRALRPQKRLCTRIRFIRNLQRRRRPLHQHLPTHNLPFFCWSFRLSYTHQHGWYDSRYVLRCRERVTK